MADNLSERSAGEGEKAARAAAFREFADTLIKERVSLIDTNRIKIDSNNRYLAYIYRGTGGVNREHYLDNGTEESSPSLNASIYLKRGSAGEYRLERYIITNESLQGVLMVDCLAAAEGYIIISKGNPGFNYSLDPTKLPIFLGMMEMNNNISIRHALFEGKPVADEVAALKTRLQDDAVEKDGISFSLIKGKGPAVKRGEDIIDLDQVRMVKKDPKGELIFDITFPIGMTSEDVKNIMEGLIGEEVLNDPLNVPAAADKKLLETNPLAALGITVETPGLYGHTKESFRQALKQAKLPRSQEE